MAETTAKVVGTEIRSCTCSNKYQDQKYGSMKRVHNKGPKAGPNSTPGSRCSVCGSTKSA